MAFLAAATADGGTSVATVIVAVAAAIGLILSVTQAIRGNGARDRANENAAAVHELRETVDFERRERAREAKECAEKVVALTKTIDRLQDDLSEMRKQNNRNIAKEIATELLPMLQKSGVTP